MGYASRTRDLNEVRDGGFRAYLTFLADRVSGRHWQMGWRSGRWCGAAAAGEEDKNPRFGCEMCWEGEEYIEANMIGRLGFV